jgi:hypothetical protein
MWAAALRIVRWLSPSPTLSFRIQLLTLDGEKTVCLYQLPTLQADAAIAKSMARQGAHDE